MFGFRTTQTEPEAPVLPGPEATASVQPPPPDPIWTAYGASEGDPIVYVRGDDGVLHQCRSSRDRMRQIRVGSQVADHVEDKDGVWVYQLRSY